MDRRSAGPRPELRDGLLDRQGRAPRCAGKTTKENKEKVKFAAYDEQSARWPSSGRHILAQFDRHTIIVYQAYAAPIGSFAVENQRFGGPFSFNRMSWIKPNFLWMMYRSGWGTKGGQEMVLAIRIQRSGFNT